MSAQEEAEPLIGASGTVTVTGDFYGFDGNGNVPLGPRRPASLMRFVIAPTLTIAGRISLPLTIAFSSRETSTVTPPLQEASLSQFLQNSANSFGMSPKLGWAQIHLGSHSTRFSDLSAGSVQTFGLGAELTPGRFRLALSAGATERAVEVDTTTGTRGAFARHMYAGSLGYVSDDTELAINVVRAQDDPASIPDVTYLRVIEPDAAAPALRDTISARHSLMPTPSESTVTTISGRFPVTDFLRVSAEAGASVFTRDMNAPDIGERAGEIDQIVPMQTSSQADVAAKMAIELDRPTWGIVLDGAYVGPGFRSLAFPYMQSDRLDFSITPRIGLLDDAISLAGTIGRRSNNLTNSAGATTNQLLASANLDLRVVPSLMLSGSYSNFGITTNATNDTFSIRTISQSVNLTPVLTIDGSTIVHTLTATYAIDDFDDLNPASGSLTNNRTQSVMGSYSATFTAVPLTFDASGLYLTNNLASGALELTGFTLGLGYRFFDDAVTPVLSIGHTTTQSEGQTADADLVLRLSAVWRVTSNLRFTLTASRTDYQYGSSRANAAFHEQLVRTSLAWQL